MTDNIEYISKEVDKLKARNTRVEADKAWETSYFRRITIALLTYSIIVIFLFYVGFSEPFVSAIIPTIGFGLSTLVLSFLKKRWIDNYYSRGK